MNFPSPFVAAVVFERKLDVLLLLLSCRPRSRRSEPGGPRKKNAALWILRIIKDALGNGAVDDRLLAARPRSGLGLLLPFLGVEGQATDVPFDGRGSSIMI